MKKQFLSLSALFVAIMLSAFETIDHETVKEKQKNDAFAWYYFHFVGIRNCEEGDRTKWEEMPYILYLMQPCSATHYGCKLTANQIEVVNGVIRPKQIYLVPGTKDPTTGAFVVDVSNHEN